MISFPFLQIPVWHHSNPKHTHAICFGDSLQLESQTLCLLTVYLCCNEKIKWPGKCLERNTYWWWLQSICRITATGSFHLSTYTKREVYSQGQKPTYSFLFLFPSNFRKNRFWRIQQSNCSSHERLLRQSTKDKTSTAQSQ